MMRGKKNTGTHFIFKSEKFVNGIEVIVFFTTVTNERTFIPAYNILIVVCICLTVYGRQELYGEFYECFEHEKKPRQSCTQSRRRCRMTLHGFS